MENVEYLGFLIEITLSEEGSYEYSVFDMTGKDKPELPLFETGDVGFVSHEAAVDDAKSWTRAFLFYDGDRIMEHIEKLYATKKALRSSPSTATAGRVLQKLTVDVFNRPDCPAWANYAAVASGGNAIYFSNKPYPADIAGVWHGAERWDFAKLKCDATDWQNSLIERPKKNTLPDWCKVGEWVYYFNEVDGWEYIKITGIKNGYVEVKETGWLDSGQIIYSVFVENSKPARLRPYTDDELRGLVGKTINDASCAFLVTSYNSFKHAIKINEEWMTANQLLLGAGAVLRYTVDGKPCGVFAHLNDAGEWVE